MQLTRAADYAVRAAVYLAALPAGNRAALPTIAQATNGPEQFLSKVMQQLVRAGLAFSARGGKGGFALARPAARINLLQVIEAIEGPIALNVCLATGTACERQSWCAAHLVWADAQRAMESVLRKADLETLARQSAERLVGLQGDAPAPHPAGEVTPWN